MSKAPPQPWVFDPDKAVLPRVEGSEVFCARRPGEQRLPCGRRLGSLATDLGTLLSQYGLATLSIPSDDGGVGPGHWHFLRDVFDRAVAQGAGVSFFSPEEGIGWKLNYEDHTSLPVLRPTSDFLRSLEYGASGGFQGARARRRPTDRRGPMTPTRMMSQIGGTEPKDRELVEGAGFIVPFGILYVVCPCDKAHRLEAAQMLSLERGIPLASAREICRLISGDLAFIQDEWTTRSSG